MKVTYQFLLIFFSLLIFNCSNHYTKKLIKKSDETSVILIKNVDIFNGKDAEIIKNKDVVLEDGNIKIITENFTSNDKKYTIVDGEGKTLMPGFIDAHVHLSGNGAVSWEKVSTDETYNLAAYLYAGITTVYDLGGLASDTKKLSEKVKSGKIIGPNIYNSHLPITVKNGHPVPLTKELLGFPLKMFVNSLVPTIEKKEDATEIIDDYIENKIDFVKIIYDQIPSNAPEMKFDELKALIDASHKKGYKVFVHIGSPQNAVDAINAGADILAHGIWRGKLTPKQADVIAKSKIPIIYTLAAFQNVHTIHQGEFQPNNYDTLLVPKIILKPVTKENGLDVKKQKAMGAFFADVTNNNPFLFDNFQLLLERNAKIIVGTDSSLPGTYAGSTYFQELDALKNYGLSNFDILTGATYESSKLFLENPDFGIIEEGKKANLLLINGNPLENSELVKSPEKIFMEGNIIDRIK